MIGWFLGHFNQNLIKLHYFYQHYQSLYGLMSENIKNFEFVQGVDFELIPNLSNNRTKYLFVFDDSS